MNRRQRRTLVAAAVCALAISLAAATLDSTVNATGGGVDTGDTPTVFPTQEGDRPEAAVGPPCVPWLATPWVALGLLGLFAGAAVVVWRRFGRFEMVAYGIGVGVPGLALYGLVTACASGCAVEIVLERFEGMPVLPPVGGAGDGPAPAIPAAFVGVVLLAGVGLAAVLLTLSLTDRDGEPSENEDEDESDGAAAARAASDAAGRIADDGDLETEIHRAWRTMATHLDVRRPASSTPGEFAEAAIEAGLDPEAVEELTALFEEVRYGGLEASDDREARALDALRRIEAAYGLADDPDRPDVQEGE